MNPFRLLIAEDNEKDLKTCRDSVERYMHEKKRSLKLVECRTAADAIETLDSSFDGAIIDLTLADRGDEGNQIINKIQTERFRIPVAIMTGTPDSADGQFTYIGVFKKGETSYEEILDSFFGIYDTGLTRIMGGRGIIEKTLNDVFLMNLLPQRSAWVEYGRSDKDRTEKALLRFTLNHLMQLLDKDDDPYFPEEVYICPPISADLKTGSIVAKKSDGSLHIVLSPACDLVIRKDGKFKTDRILFVDIEDDSCVKKIVGIQNSRNKKALKTIVKCKYHNEEALSYKYVLQLQNESVNGTITKIFRNSHDHYHHWLPQTDCFQGGFINFRRIETVSPEEFSKIYDPPKIQVSPFFIKDIVARFSSYYARQGQPDVEVEDKNLKKSDQ